MAIARKKTKDGKTRYYVVRRIEGRKVWYPGGHATLRDARAADAKLTTDDAKGRDTRPRPETVNALVDRWLRAKAAAGKHRPRTSERREVLYRRHVAPVIGGMRASAVREADVQRVIEAMAADGLAPATIDQAYRVVTAAFRFGKLGVDLRDVERPEVRRRELAIPNASNVSAILRAAEGHPMHLPLTIAAHTGLRRSEVLALRWTDVDLDVGRLRVQQAASFQGRTVVLAETKTKNAKRTVSFGPALVNVLREAKAEQAARRLVMGAGWRDTGLVVDNAEGSPVHPERLTQYFDRLANRLGLGGVTLHTLRHFAISTWLRAGVPVLVVSRMAGHAKASFTMDTYGHCIPEDQDAAVVAMDRALAGGGT